MKRDIASLDETPDVLERLYRDVIIGAFRDMGQGTEREAGSVRAWMQRDSFLVCCEIANWDDGWARELLNSIGSLGDGVRVPIARECMILLRAASRINVGLTQHGDNIIMDSNKFSRALGVTETHDVHITNQESQLRRMNRLRAARGKGKIGNTTDSKGPSE